MSGLHLHGPGHAHSHAGQHAHHHHHAPAGSDWRYALAIGLNLAFVALEAVMGLFANSTALLADAGHNLSDVLGLALAGGAAWLARKRGDDSRTYGFGKATILAALANAVVLVFACGAIALEAVKRFGDPVGVASGLVMATAGAGFVINLLTALLFLRGRKTDLNERGAFLHMIADAAVSLGVVVAGGLIWMTSIQWIDPLASLLIVAVILAGTWELLRDSLNLALDAAPRGLKVAEVRDYLCGLPGVEAAHDVHVWAMSTTETALTAHLVRAEGADPAFLVETLNELRVRFGIDHATLQVETSAMDSCPTC